MKKLDNLVGIAFFALIFIGVPCKAWWDFHHPENWNREPANNPQIYLPVMAFAWFLSLYIVTRIFIGERKVRRRARLAALLIRAEALVKQHRRDEAAAVLKECEALLSKVQSS